MSRIRWNLNPFIDHSLSFSLHAERAMYVTAISVITSPPVCIICKVSGKSHQLKAQANQPLIFALTKEPSSFEYADTHKQLTAWWKEKKIQTQAAPCTNLASEIRNIAKTM